MLLAVGFVPVPPLILPALARGAAGELDGCRERCRAVITGLRDREPARLVVVADGPSGRFTSGDVGSLAGFGLPAAAAGVALPGPPERRTTVASTRRTSPPPATPPRQPMPPSLAVAAWLLTDAGWELPVDAWTLPASSTKDDVRALAQRLHRTDEHVVLLAVGEGSARLDLRAPGSLDVRAVEWQEGASHALAHAHLDDVLALDPAHASGFLATGRAPWQVAAAMAQASDAEWRGTLLADERPYGVAYVTARWTRE